MGDLGWGHLISSSVFHISTISWDVINSTPSYDSEAEDMTNFIIWARVRTGPFHRGMASFLDRENMSTRSSAVFVFVVKYCVRMCTKNHIAGAIEDPIGEVCGTIIEWLVYFFV